MLSTIFTPRRAVPAALVLCLALFSGLAGARELPAQIDWAERLELGTPLSGIVARVSAETGQRVRKGDVLVRMDDRGIRARLEEDEAQVRRLELARAEAELEYERQQEMYDRTLISVRDLNLAEIGFAMADAEFIAARARLTRTRLDLEYSEVRAPFDALVVARHVRPGQTVNNELRIVPMVALAATDPMIARARVPETELSGLETGQRVAVRVGERRYEGTLQALGLEPVDNTDDAPHYALTVHFSAPAEDGLRAGQRAVVVLGHD